MKKNTKVLIVDDERQNVQIMREMLSFHPKYECRGANSGQEALSILKNYFPEIILLDIMMPPGMNGYEVCRRIRAHKEHKFAKIIMVSGMSMVDDRLKGYDAGADDYLTKPYVENELLAKLEVYSKLSRIEEVDTLKTTALNILSHETRTPLNGILLGSELLRDMEDMTVKAKQYIELVHESGLRIQELVEKISRYYNVKDGVQKSLTENSFSYLLGKLMDDLRGHGVDDKVEVACDCADAIHFTADWLLLKEALGYVVDNALKSTSASSLVSIKCLKREGGVSLQVGDRGPGVAQSMTEKVFDGLFSPDILHHTQGTGLGLAIAKEIVEEHGGKITCANRKGGGSLFEIFIPIPPR